MSSALKRKSKDISEFGNRAGWTEHAAGEECTEIDIFAWDSLLEADQVFRLLLLPSSLELAGL